jgi:carboxyl-terminal processing protease
MLSPPGMSPGAGPWARTALASPRLEDLMLTNDDERITTGSTIDEEPPSVSSTAPGPSQVSTSPATPRRRRSWLVRSVVGLALVATFSTGIGVGRVMSPAVGGDAATPSPAASGSGPTDFNLIREAWDTIHQNYVDAGALDDKGLIYGAIDGMTQAVGDTGHTSFMTPEERKDRSDSLSGSYVGIGAQMDVTEDGLPLVVGVFRDSPAEKAGVEAGDVFVKVDGKSTEGVALDEVLTWVRGEAGTPVVLTLRKGDAGPERELRIVRADVKIDPISWTLVPGTRTAVLRLEQFSAGSADEIVTALKAIREAGADRLILDLRGNPGGYVGEAVGIASQFLTSGTVYMERDAKGVEKSNPVSPGGVWRDLPVIVLVDGSTASSSEIVSGALQDAGRATIVGVKTFGTGTVLGEFSLSDGSALRIGTVEWLTPDGRRIWHEGIAPDVVVERASDVQPTTPDDIRKMTAADVLRLSDPQLAQGLERVAQAK